MTTQRAPGELLQARASVQPACPSLGIRLSEEGPPSPSGMQVLGKGAASGLKACVAPLRASHPALQRLSQRGPWVLRGALVNPRVPPPRALVQRRGSLPLELLLLSSGCRSGRFRKQSIVPTVHNAFRKSALRWESTRESRSTSLGNTTRYKENINFLSK